MVQQDRLELRGHSQDGDEETGLTPELYNACLIINNWHNKCGSDEPMKLVLKYFMVLTRQRDCYPIRLFSHFNILLLSLAKKPL